MTPVSLVADVPTAMVVRAAGPFLSVQEVVAAAKAAPGRYTFGSGGAGSSNHLSGALFASAAGVELTHISYRGAAPAMTALYAGEIDMVFASTVETLPHVRGGRARLLGVATPERIAALPDTPAIAEIVPGYVALNWYAIAGPRGVPPAIVARFAETLGTLRDLPDVKARFAAAGTVPLLTGPRELAALLETDVPKWQRVVTDAGIRVE
jgi:tripartite-type tricarboxylate transporter receptor subunit TctC